jgi:hypothetical protein
MNLSEVMKTKQKYVKLSPFGAEALARLDVSASMHRKFCLKSGFCSNLIGAIKKRAVPQPLGWGLRAHRPKAGSGPLCTGGES